MFSIGLWKFCILQSLVNSSCWFSVWCVTSHYYNLWSSIYQLCGGKFWIQLCSCVFLHHLCCVDCCCGILFLGLFIGLFLAFLYHLYVYYFLEFSEFRFILWFDVYRFTWLRFLICILSRSFSNTIYIQNGIFKINGRKVVLFQLLDCLIGYEYASIMRLQIWNAPSSLIIASLSHLCLIIIMVLIRLFVKI